MTLVLTETAAPTSAQGPVDVVLQVAAMPSGTVLLDPPGKASFGGDFNECRFDYPDGECPVTYSVPAGASLTVTLTAVPDPTASPAQRFQRWSLPECGTGPTCRIELTPGVEPPEVWALFTPATFSVLIAGDGLVRGANGTIDCVSPEPVTPEPPAPPPPGINCSASDDAETSLTLTAEPKDGSLVTWVFGCDPGDDPHATTCVLQPENRYIGVRFGDAPGPAPPFDVSVSLRVSKSGTGAGVVTGGPPPGETGGKIECGSTCIASPALRFGTRVKLTAEPSSGSHFVRWVGAPCSTLRTCVLNAGPVTAVRAVFESDPQPSTAPGASPTPSRQPQPTPLLEPPPPPALPAEPARAASKPLKLKARLVGVSSGRIAGRYGVTIRLDVTKLVNARFRLTRGARVLGQRLVLLRKARSTTWVALARSARRGTCVLLIQLRDRDGQIVTIQRRVDLGR